MLPTAAALLGIEVALFALLHLRPTGIPRPGAVPGLAAVSLSELTVAVLVAPWIEEALFRGSLQQRLERRWGPHLAILAVAAGFALLHLRPTALPGHLVAGVVYGYVAYGAQSIGPAIAVHALFNAGFALLAPGLAAGMLHHPAAAGTLTGLAAVALVALLHGSGHARPKPARHPILEPNRSRPLRSGRPQARPTPLRLPASGAFCRGVESGALPASFDSRICHASPHAPAPAPGFAGTTGSRSGAAPALDRVAPTHPHDAAAGAARLSRGSGPPRATELRQSSPFVGILPRAERDALFRYYETL